jgi:hypothetical protein
MIHTSHTAITDRTMFRANWTPYLKKKYLSEKKTPLCNGALFMINNVYDGPTMFIYIRHYNDDIGSYTTQEHGRLYV